MANEHRDEQLKAALDHIAHMELQRPAHVGEDQPSEWKCSGGLIYRLNHRGVNQDSIKVEMVDGSYHDAPSLAERAKQLCALLNAAR